MGFIRAIRETLRGEPEETQLTPQALYAAALEQQYPKEKMQEVKLQTRFTYTEGPMIFLGQQIVKGMQEAGYPSRVVFGRRTAERQAKLYAKGRTAPGRKVTRAGPWESAHQFDDAVDICHKSKGWDVSKDYWETLASVVRIVGEVFDVQLEHGHYWRFKDSAHIELNDWKANRARLERIWAEEEADRIRAGDPPGIVKRHFNQSELWERFCEVLPDVAKRHSRRGG
ncbi:hypothetical protein AIOL_002209 [Candidatus Rhodobacter oscarellae]|uniref:Uncharacterized protein n=1 Tax=Candidatus Rhodobacter oscarellae TaxID=1675527 RepID=A0A0J9GUI4_9RHOB|nr:M15 family metallopeptidase [Candidatus Rhodobacter lobularis]KMW57248.1 hypothetical protein AIOL_002209 [Candidatus Rhodobacter lobularis]